MYIRNYKNYKNHSKVNEEFLGKLIKRGLGKLKSKVAISLSKKIGSAKDVDKLIEKYKSELNQLAEDKKKKLKAIAELEKAKAEGGDVSEKIEKAVEAYKKSEKVYEKQRDNLKQKFDIQFKKIAKEEDNPAIEEYIKLKKIDMVSEMLQQEMVDLNEEMGITEEDIESSEILQNIINTSKVELEKTQKMKEQVEKAAQEAGESTGGEEGGGIEPGSEIKYTYTNNDGKEIENEATISKNQDDLEDDQVRVETENNPDGIKIKKDQIVKGEEKEENAGSDEGGEDVA